MKKLAILMLLFQSFRWAHAQDERYFRQLFTGEAAKTETFNDEKKYIHTFKSPAYRLDLNQDNVPEEIVFSKKDGEDWLEIYYINGQGVKDKLLSYRFENNGYESELFRLELKKISAKTTLILFHYFEGISHFSQFQSSARVYVASIDNNNLKTISMFKGPSVFEELKTLRAHFRLRNYKVYLEDFNNDGVKELVFKFNLNTNVFIYGGDGKWMTFRS